MNRFQYPRRLAVVALACWTLCVLGFVNPDFTPIHLTSQSSQVALFTFTLPDDESNVLILSLVETLKGEAPAFTTIDISGLDDEQREQITHPEQDMPRPLAMVFIAADGSGASLHLGQYWATMTFNDDGVPAVDEWEDGHLLGVWDGGTDQLARVVSYILRDPDPRVPVGAEAEWNIDGTVLGHAVAGAVSAVRPVILNDEELPLVYIAAEGGDHLMRWDDDREALVAVHGEIGLQSRSRHHAWGDFTGDGRLDLVSADGEALWLWTRSDGQEFSAQVLELSDAAAITGLAAAAGEGRQRLLVSMPDALVAVSCATTSIEEQRRFESAVEIADAGPCLVGDFTGDGEIDYLLIHGDGAVLYAAPEWVGVAVEGAIGPGKPRFAAAADLDSNGLPEIITVGDSGVRLWHNQGEGRVISRADYSGEFRYISNPSMTGITIGDFNNDGRPDLVLFNPGMGPHLFYGRGFMVFGFAEDLTSEIPVEIFQGQRGGALIDVTGDGAQDLVTVLEDGQVLLLRRNVEDYQTMGVSLRLAGAAAHAGPIMVSAGDEDRENYGAQILQPGGEMFYGRAEPGPLMIRWTLPGGQSAEDMLILEQGHQILTIGGSGQ